jgi:TRAP-type uncharacterized transport system substrate-binding protein
MHESRQPFRLEIVPHEDSIAAAAALDAGRVDLALVRSDDPTSAEARSIVVVQKRHAILVARQDGGIAGWSYLRGRSVGVVRGDTDSSLSLVERILDHNGVSASDVRLSDIALQDAAGAIAERKVDALVFVAWPGHRLRGLIGDVSDSRRTPVTIIGVPAASALAFRYRDIEASELPAGVLGGAPALPAQPTTTIAISYEIAASSQMSDAVATALTGALLDASPRMRRMQENTFNIETPPLDRPRRFTPHPGVAAYVNNEAMGFLDTYSEYIWLGLFALSILGSSVMGVLGWAGLREERPRRRLEIGMPELLAALEQARTPAEIDAVEDRFDALAQEMLLDYARGTLAPGESDPAPWISLFSRLLHKRRLQIDRPTPAALRA